MTNLTDLQTEALLSHLVIKTFHTDKLLEFKITNIYIYCV